MSVLAGIEAAALVLLILAGIGAAVLVVLVLSVIERVVSRFRHGCADISGYQEMDWTPTDREVDDEDDLAPDELQEPSSIGWSWRSATRESGPGTVIVETRPPAGVGATAERGAGQQMVVQKQTWIIHPNHVAHWQDEASGCPLCRDELE